MPTLARAAIACLICVVGWFLAPNSSKPGFMRNRAARRVQLVCVSHGCELWDGPILAAEDVRALQQAHALIHTKRAITINDIIQENK